jgi:flagellar hook-associated protein 3 FlgL
MRISERMRYDQVENRVHDAKSQNADAMERLSSQKDVRKLSDNPIAATQIIRHRDAITDTMQFQKNIEYSKGLLERSETALGSIADGLMRAKELAVGMANDTYDAKSRDASGREVREIMEQVVQLANTSFNGRYIFGGFRNQTPPLSLDGEYVGDDGRLFLQISPGDFRQVNVPGRFVFEASADERSAGHFDMIHTLDMLYDGLTHDNKDSIRAAMGELDHQLEKTTSHQATIGAAWNTLNTTGDRLGNEETVMRTQLSKAQDVDFYDATSEFKRTEVVLQSTLMASTKLLQPSLLNFLQ